MNKYIFTIIISIVGLITACSNNKNSENTNANDYYCEIISDTLPIEKNRFAFLTSTTYNDSLRCVFRKIGENKLCIAEIENKNLRVLQEFSLSDTTMFSVQIDKEMQDSIFFQRVFIINYDTIIFFNRGRANEMASRILWYYDTKNDKIKIFDSFESPNYMEVNSYSKIKEPYFYNNNMNWNKTKQCLYSKFISYDTSGNHMQTDSFLIEIYPFKNKREILPITFVADTGKNSIYPYWDRIYPCADEKGTYYIAFGTSSQIYTFDKSLKKTDIKHPNYSAPQAYIIPESGLIGNDFVRVGTTTFAYKNFTYDKFNNCFYRLYEMEMPEKTPEGFKTIYPDDKKFGLNVISHDLLLLADIIIDQKHLNFFENEIPHITTKNGIENLYFDSKSNKLIHKVLTIKHDKK